jgi:hypothetical protein
VPAKQVHRKEENKKMKMKFVHDMLSVGRTEINSSMVIVPVKPPDLKHTGAGPRITLIKKGGKTIDRPLEGCLCPVGYLALSLV